MPMSIRLDDDLRELLSKGAKRTRHKKQTLVRLTLRRHLPEVIERESLKAPARVTSLAPWPRGALAKAYKRAGKGQERIEASAATAQGKPSWQD
jgi:predicted transcriptional regulator